MRGKAANDAAPARPTATGLKSQGVPEHQDAEGMGALALASEAAVPMDRTTSALARDLLRDDEVVILMLRPSIWFVLLASLGSLAFIALVTFALAYAAGFMSQLPMIGWTDRQAFGLGVGLAMLRVGWQLLEWLSRVYVLTDRRIITRSGVLRVSVFEVPLRNVQHTIVFARLRERIFGLGSIGFATAGSDSFETFWTMIRNPYAVHKAVADAIERYGG